MRQVRAGVVAVLAGVATLAAGCGVPTGGAPAAIPSSAVPFGLLSSTPSSAAPSPTTARAGEPRVYLVGPDKRLVARSRQLSLGTVREELDGLLSALASGPTSSERLGELSTALPPDARLSVARLENGAATIDIVGATDPSGRWSRLAVGQIVLTATSLPDVRSVLLQRNGNAVEAPLPGGQLTSQPLIAGDYDSLLVTPPG